MAAVGSVISSSKAPLPLLHRIKTSKQIKLWKWDTCSKVLSSLATCLHGWVSINTTSLIRAFIFSFHRCSIWSKKTFKSSLCRGSLPHRCSSALRRLQQHSDCAVSLVQRSLLVVGRHGRSWNKKEKKETSAFCKATITAALISVHLSPVAPVNLALNKQKAGLRLRVCGEHSLPFVSSGNTIQSIRRAVREEPNIRRTGWT